jgi:hypothetical protein
MQLFQTIAAVNVAAGKQTNNRASASKVVRFIM